MASAINNGTFSFNPEELKDFGKIIHELVFGNEELRKIHDIQQGIFYDQQIVFAGKIGLMGKAVTGCTPNEITGVTLTQKFWTPVKEDFRLKHCSADVNAQDKLVQQMARMNPDFYDIVEGSQGEIGAFLVAKVLEGFIENLLRKVWFSDKLADTIANGGDLTNGTDKDYFNTFDGLFLQIMVNIPIASQYYVVAPRNSGVTYAAQALVDGDAIGLLKAMYNKADSRLLGVATKMFLVTRTVWDGYLNDLESIQNSGAGNTMLNENGQMVLRYRGVEVVNMETWDRNIDAYYNTGVFRDKPNRAILTVNTNIPIGTLAEDDFGTVDAFYDKRDKSNFIDGIYTIDSKHLENYLTVAAY